MGRRRSRLFANGRNATATSFIKMDNWMFDCAPFRRLKPGPRCLLFELIRRFNGSNNGSIGLGVREAAKQLGVNKDTASAYFLTLIQSGFIASTRAGGFNIKDPASRRATEWRLTWMNTDCMPATKDFMKAPEKSAVPNNRTNMSEKTGQ